MRKQTAPTRRGRPLDWLVISAFAQIMAHINVLVFVIIVTHIYTQF
jgi:hypothetical protein